jgi:hypothetical protein
MSRIKFDRLSIIQVYLGLYLATGSLSYSSVLYLYCVVDFGLYSLNGLILAEAKVTAVC